MEELINKIKLDPYLNHLGISLDDWEEGYAKCSLTVKQFMINFLGVPHGGLLFSLADAALSAASNSDHKPSYAINISGSFLSKAKINDKLTSIATRVHSTRKTGLYKMDVFLEKELLATFNGTVYRSSK